MPSFYLLVSIVLRRDWKRPRRTFNIIAKNAEVKKYGLSSAMRDIRVLIFKNWQLELKERLAC